MIEIADSAPNEAPIENVFVFVSEDRDGNQGIVSGSVGDIVYTPLITSKLRIAEMLKPIAEELARKGGLKVKLVHFTRVQTLWQTNPNHYRRDA
jgi:hypothetical protein